jgi:hypothetical protein
MKPRGKPGVRGDEAVRGDDVLRDLSEHPARREQGDGADREQQPELHVRGLPLVPEPAQRRNPSAPHSAGESARGALSVLNGPCRKRATSRSPGAVPAAGP